MFPKFSEDEGRDARSSVDLKEDKRSLLSGSSDSTLADGFSYELRDHRYYKKRQWHIFHLIFLYSVIIATATGLVILGFRKGNDPGLAVYSPAQSAVSYNTVTFAPSEYYGPPSPKRNQIWQDLYHRGVITRISREEATGLRVNNTYELPNGDHVIQLEMFHQLHCLNTLRRSIYRDDFPHFSPYSVDGQPKKTMMRHLDHCVDRLRQGIMCAGNVGAEAWVKHAGVPKEGAPFEQWLQLNHHPTMTCRNFEQVQQWAFERELEGWEQRDDGEGIKMMG